MKRSVYSALDLYPSVMATIWLFYALEIKTDYCNAVLNKLKWVKASSNHFVSGGVASSNVDNRKEPHVPHIAFRLTPNVEAKQPGYRLKFEREAFFCY